MYLQDIKSSPSLTGQNNNRSMSPFRLNLLTKTTLKLKTPGGIIVFWVSEHVWGEQEWWYAQVRREVERRNIQKLSQKKKSSMLQGKLEYQVWLKLAFYKTQKSLLQKLRRISFSRKLSYESFSFVYLWKVAEDWFHPNADIIDPSQLIVQQAREKVNSKY